MSALKIFLIVWLLSLVCLLLADNEADSIAAYSIYWKTAGSNAVIDSVITINATAIPDSIKEYGTDNLIPPAQPVGEYDNSLTFNMLMYSLSRQSWIQNVHAQIYIPPGTYCHVKLDMTHGLRIIVSH